MKIATLASAAALALAAASPASAQDLQSGNRTVSGELQSSDPMMDEDVHYDDHRIRLRAGDRLRITLESEAFDPMLQIYGAGDMQTAIAENDDYGDSLNSRISFSAPADGDYVVRVLAFEPGTFGAYTLRAEAMPPLPPPAALGRPAGTSTTTWRHYQGALAESDPDNEGAHFDDYRVTLRAGETVFVRVDAEEFDPMIHILSGADRHGGPIDGDDDAGPGLNSMVGFQAEEAGEYLIRVTSFSPGETGSYTLRVGN